MYLYTPDISNYIPLNRKLSPVEKTRFKRVINNVVLYYLQKIIYKQFKIKALKGVDSLGVIWKPTTTALEAWKRKTKKPIKKLGGEVGINVRYGDLLKSLTPGKLLNYEYRPTELQHVRVTAEWFIITYLVDYSDEVNEVRAFIPDDIEQWIEEALTDSITDLKRYFRAQGLLRSRL